MRCNPYSSEIAIMNILSGMFDRPIGSLAASLIMSLAILPSPASAGSQPEAVHHESSSVEAKQSASRKPSDNADTDNDILVIGQKGRDKIIQGYVQGLTYTDRFDPVTRYEPYTFCPASIGLDAQQNSLIEQRMRKVAAAAGVKPAKPGCKPSAMVFFVNDKKQFLTAFRKDHPIYFIPFLSHARLPIDQPGPATAWHLVQRMDQQGKPVLTDGLGVQTISSTYGGSKLNALFTKAVAMSVVVIERKSLLGLTTMQIADYATMRCLTEVEQKAIAKEKAPTILTVLNSKMGSSIPLSLTKWDFAYIKTRYEGDPRRYSLGKDGQLKAALRHIDDTPQQKSINKSN